MPNQKLRTLIVDDEPLARQTVRRLLAADLEIEIVGECGDGKSALKAITSLKPDLVYLDIRMPGLSGLGVLTKIKPTDRPAVIFATAYDDFALKAFELFAVDYLLKPFTDERFSESLLKGKQRARRSGGGALDATIDSLLEHYSRRNPPPGASRAYTAAMPFKVGLDRHLLRPCDIRWIEGQSDYVRIHTTKQPVLIRRTMSHLLTQLPAGKFVRIHKSAIINLDYIKRMRSAWSGDWALELDDGTQLKVSRNYREQLEKLLPANSG